MSPEMPFSPLLPNEPRVLDWAGEHALTEAFLMPALPALESLFRQLRATLDPLLRQAQPVKLDKPYPLGQCLEISTALQQHLQQLDPALLAGAPAQGYAALAAFLRHGGRLRQVWGDLRGEYFQNAFLAGTLYIDVSNDTVVRSKPPVEILPFADARFGPVEDYRHFARVAARYWRAHVFPNHVAPALAPYFPLITASKGGRVEFQPVSNYMIGLTLAAQFRPSAAVLDAEPMPGDLFQLLSRCLADTPIEVAGDPLQGQAQALRYCDQYRAEGRHQSDQQRSAAVKAILRANQRLAHLRLAQD